MVASSIPGRKEELVGIFNGIRWTSNEGDFIIGSLRDGECVMGNCDPSDLVSGITYRFVGKWTESPQFGSQFKFTAFVQHEPHSRNGVVEYLKRYAPNVGDSIAHQLVDLYGADRAIACLKADPVAASKALRGLPVGKAEEAAKALKEQERFQETKVKLIDLFAERGFRHSLVDECVRRLGVLAPVRIKRDPFVLLSMKFTGCGFLRVDRLYLELGLPPDRMKRQVMAMWHVVHSDMSGSTWHPEAKVIEEAGRLITGRYRPERAMRVATRAKWLIREDRDGEWWIADGKAAQDENYVAERIAVLA